jgi:hypothetical protein
MGHVRDEIAPDSLHPFEVGDVAADHERLPVAVGHELHRQDVVTAA